MLGSMFYLLFGDPIVSLLLALSRSPRPIGIDTPVDPDDLIKKADFMFPEDFLSRYPHESNAFRLKIFTYLVFNLLVKGHDSVDPGRVWSNYNRDDYYRILIDAAFYEYLTNFTDTQSKDFEFNLSESSGTHLPGSNEEIAVDRIGEYLDNLSETESKPERTKSTYGMLSEFQTADCDTQIIIHSSGIPGIDYPNFCDIPETSFSCGDKRIPGIYADFETGCQVFHVCWFHRIDSFLCPIGTIFNQSLLTCDIWRDTGCYSSPQFFDRDQFLIDGVSTERDVPDFDGSCDSLLIKPLLLHAKFMPAKCEVKDRDFEYDLHIKDTNDLQRRLDKAYDLVWQMLIILREIRKELASEMKNRGIPWFQVLARHLELQSDPKPTTETMEESTEFTRELSDTELEASETAEQANHYRKLSSGTKSDVSVTRSTPLMPSNSLDEHVKSLKQDVPEIVMGSLRLGGNILNEGIPLTKQVIIDSYRKIDSKKP